MSALAEATVLYTAVVAVLCLILAVTGRPRPGALDAALGLVAVATTAVSVLGLVAVLRGRHPAELATHLGYLLTAPFLLPLAAGSFGGDRGRWASAALATGCLVLVVVLIRTVATSRA